MNTETAQVDDLQLVALPSAVSCTDIFVRFTLTEWDLRPMIEDGVNAATELVQTVVDGTDSKSPGLVAVRLRLHGDRLVIEVNSDRVRQHELPLPTGLTASDIPLPQRDPKKSAAGEQDDDYTAEMDPEVMQRILAGLSRSSPQ